MKRWYLIAPYANRSNAERAAKMQWNACNAALRHFALQLAEGRADLHTENASEVSGFKTTDR